MRGFFGRALLLTIGMSWAPQGMLWEVLHFCEEGIRQKGKTRFFLSHECIGKQSGYVKSIDSLPV